MKVLLAILALSVAGCAAKTPKSVAFPVLDLPMIVCIMDQHGDPMEGVHTLWIGGEIQFTDPSGCVMFLGTGSVLFTHPDIPPTVADPKPGFNLYRVTRLVCSSEVPTPCLRRPA